MSRYRATLITMSLAKQIWKSYNAKLWSWLKSAMHVTSINLKSRILQTRASLSPSLFRAHDSAARYRVPMSSFSSLQLLPLVGYFHPFCGFFSVPCGSFCCHVWPVYSDFRGWLATYLDRHRVCVCVLGVFSLDLCGFLVHDEIFNSPRCLVGNGLRDSSHLKCFLATPWWFGVSLLKQLLLWSPFRIEWPSLPWNWFIIFIVCSSGILSLNYDNHLSN